MAQAAAVKAMTEATRLSQTIRRPAANASTICCLTLLVAMPLYQWNFDESVDNIAAWTKNLGRASQQWW